MVFLQKIARGRSLFMCKWMMWFLMKRKKGKISIVDVNFYSLHKCTQIIYYSIFSILPYTVLVAITYKPLQKHQLLKNWSEKSYFEQFLRGMVGEKKNRKP